MLQNASPKRRPPIGLLKVKIKVNKRVAEIVPSSRSVGQITKIDLRRK